MEVDDIGWMMLEELQHNARISYRDLGAKVGLTAPAVADRIRKMEKAGVLMGYRAIIDHEAIGAPILAIVRLKTRGDAVKTVNELVVQLPEILEAHRVTGSENFVIRAILKDMHHLEALLDQLNPFGETITNVVTSSAVKRRVITDPARW